MFHTKVDLVRGVRRDPHPRPTQTQLTEMCLLRGLHFDLDSFGLVQRGRICKMSTIFDLDSLGRVQRGRIGRRSLYFDLDSLGRIQKGRIYRQDMHFDLDSLGRVQKGRICRVGLLFDLESLGRVQWGRIRRVECSQGLWLSLSRWEYHPSRDRGLLHTHWGRGGREELPLDSLSLRGNHRLVGRV